MKISVLSANAALDAWRVLIDAGGAGTLTFFTGSAPTNTTDADSGTVLAILTFSATSFGAAASNVITAAAITSDTDANATGTAGYWRIKSGAGTVIAQGSVAAGSGDVNMNTVSFVLHATIAISAMTVTQPLT